MLSNTQNRNVILVSGILLFISNLTSLIAQDNSNKSVITQFGQAALNGILQANYRELPIDEIFPITKSALPKIHLLPKRSSPSLIFDPSQAEKIRNRQYREPYQTWAQYIIENANSSSINPESPLIMEIHRSRFAKVQAFAFFLTRNSFYKDQALLALKNMQDLEPAVNIEGGRQDVGWGDWVQVAEALRHYAVAYDLMQSNLKKTDRNYIENIFIRHIQNLLKNRYLIPRNNHSIAIGTGVGSMAMVVDHPRSQIWFDQAMELIEDGMHLIEPDGSYREGAYYGRFVAWHLFPFAYFVYHRTHVNLFRHQKIRRLALWLTHIQKPDGEAPLFDDAFSEKLIYEPVAIGFMENSGVLRHSFEKHMGRFGPDNPNWVEAYCAFDDRVDPNLHEEKAYSFYPNGGMAIFKTDDVYGLFLGEAKRPHISGHDHIEPMAFTLSAFGQDFLIDGGYGPRGDLNPDRPWFISSHAHNIPHINGLGPDQNPVWGDVSGGELHHAYGFHEFAAASVHAQYQDAALNRDVWFVSDRYFVVIDNIHSEQKVNVNIPWHGLGDFEIQTINQFQWSQNNTTLKAEILQADEKPIAISEQVGMHTHPIQSGIHSTANIYIPNINNSSLVTLFLPENEGHLVQSIPIPIISDSLAIARRIAFNNRQGYDLIIKSTSKWQCDRLNGDAEIIVMQWIPNRPLILSFKHATHLRVDGEIRLMSDIPLTGTLVLDDRGWHGYLISSESLFDNPFNETKNKIHLFPSMNPGPVFIGKHQAFSEWHEDTLTIIPEQYGRLEMGSIHLTNNMEPYRQSMPILERFYFSNNSRFQLENLTESERIQLRNEIIQVMGKETIHLTDSLIFGKNGTANLYHLISGLLNYAYNQKGDVKFGLPQQLKLQGEIADHHVSYFEEGQVSEKGIQTFRHHISIDKALYYQYEKAFRDQNHHHLAWTGASTSMQFDMVIHPYRVIHLYQERYQDNKAYNLLLQKEIPSGWISLSQTENINHTQMTHAAFQHGLWNNQLTYHNTDDLSRLSLQSKKQHRNIGSTTYALDWDSKFGIQDTELHHAHRFNNTCFMNVEWLTNSDAANRRQSDYGITTWFNFNESSGYLQLAKKATEKMTGNWTWRTQYKTWRIDTRGWFHQSWNGGIGLTQRLQRNHLQIWLDKKYWQTNNTIHLNKQWLSTIHIQKNYEGNDSFERGFGLYYQKKYRIGGQFSIREYLDEKNYDISGILNVYLWQGEVIQTYFVSSWAENWRMERYELILSQMGGLWTPGILLQGNKEGIVRFEGFLRWIF